MTRRAGRRRPSVTIPEIESVGSPGWTNWTWDSLLVEGANCREVVDNVVDMAHFFYIHFAFPTYFKNVLRGAHRLAVPADQVAAGRHDRLELRRGRGRKPRCAPRPPTSAPPT